MINITFEVLYPDGRPVGDFIQPSVARECIAQYAANSRAIINTVDDQPNRIRGWRIGRDFIDSLLRQRGASELFIMPIIHPDSLTEPNPALKEITLLLVAIDSANRTLDGSLVDGMRPCPADCPITSLWS